MIANLGERKVDRHPDTFIAPTASIVGSVTLHQGASVWFGAVARGDTEQITIGANSNIQDGAVLHADPDQPLLIKEGATIGHNAIVHGCTVGKHSLIGMGSTVLNGAQIGDNCLIGANALVPAGMVIASGSLVLGTPAKIKRPLTSEEISSLKYSAEHYAENGRRFTSEMDILEN